MVEEKNYVLYDKFVYDGKDRKTYIYRVKEDKENNEIISEDLILD